MIEIGGKAVPVQLRRNDRARRLTMRLAADGSAVLVTLPRWTPSREALAFARTRLDWLEAQAARVPAASPVADGMAFPLRGAAITVRHVPSAKRQVLLGSGEVQLGGPAESLSPRLTRWLKAEALTLLTADLAHYCDVAGQPVPSLSLSSAQRRWGSCSARGGVRINWRLIMAPDMVRRSVVAHEVAHLVHFDHSPRFKAFLANLFEGEISDADRWLKREGRSLYRHFG